MFESTFGATACHISEDPACTFTRFRSVQVNPPPVTVVIVCADPDGPSVAMNATSNVFAAVVLNAGELMVVALVPCWVVPMDAIVMLEGAGVVTGTLGESCEVFPAASYALTVYV